jgi:IclR family transcriptional regulator, acetate operon repressor
MAREVGPQSDSSGADRVLFALRLLANQRRPMRLDEFTRELGAPKSTTHRVLRTLCRSGLAQQDEDGRYSLSLEFLRLAFRFYDGLDDRNVVQGTMQTLVDHVGETAYYGKLDGADVVYVGMATAPGYLHTATVVGARRPAHRTALGKALLAWTLLDRASVDQFVDKYGPLSAATRNSITSPYGLDHEFSLSRARGFAIDNEENEEGVVCIAFPVFLGPPSRPTGAISVAAIKMRTPLEELIERADEIRDVIERHLGQNVVSPLALPQVGPSNLSDG